MRREFYFLGAGLVLGLVMVAVWYLTQPYNYRGSLIDPPVPAADFTLVSQQGDFTLSDQQGKLVVLFFGYTTCPDICPATLGEMKEIARRLGDDAEKVKFVFVTVDPQRDSPERVGQYASNFNTSFVGLSGSEEQLTQVWADYGVYRAISEQPSSAVGYLVDHSTRLYLIDQQGNLRLTYTFGTPVDDLLSDVRHLLK